MSSANGFKPATMILAVAATIIITVVVLEYYGMIRHTDDKQAVPVGELRAVFLAPGEDFRLSPKAPQLHADCQDGYLVVVSNTDPMMRGLLVDYKDRGVQCAATASNPATNPGAETQPSPENAEQ